MVLELKIGPGRAIWTDRHGGVSEAPYDTANLGDHVGDRAAAVLENRRRLASSLELPAPEQWWWLHQEHGYSTVVANGPGRSEAPTADAVVTTRRGVPVVVLTADCAPIAIATDDAVGVVHAGWMGLLGGVVEAAVAQLRAVGRGPVRAVLGPCIRPARYEFGAEDLARLVDRLGPDVAGRTDNGRPAFDLPAGVRSALRRAGVDAFDDVEVCTAASPDHYSHRRDGVTGRQAVVVVRDALTRRMDDGSFDDVVARVHEVRGRIADAARRSGRDPATVTLVAATKTVPVELVEAVVAAGVIDVGENRAQELVRKAPVLAEAGISARWHFIGALQRNKVRSLAPWVARWHSVDREALGVEIARHAAGARVLVEVNLDAEPTKAGCPPDDVLALIDGLRGLDLVVEGLMAVPRAGVDPRPWFAALAALAARADVRELSMGMTDDFEAAIEEGATIVRVGRAIFGSRRT